jgi:hypothetical protein
MKIFVGGFESAKYDSESRIAKNTKNKMADTINE